MARRFDEALRPCGLTNGQFSLLMSINRPEPAKMAPVAALLAMDRTTLTAALKPLERRGLVQIAVDPGDSRGRLLSLTENGHRVLLDAVPIWTRMHALLESDLADPDATRQDLAVLSRRNDCGSEQPEVLPEVGSPERPSRERVRKERPCSD